MFSSRKQVTPLASFSSCFRVPVAERAHLLFLRGKIICGITTTIAPSGRKDDILTAHEKGCYVSNQFVQQRVIWKQVEFSVPLKTMKMKTFSYLEKEHSHQKSMNETNCLKAVKDITKLIVARTWKVALGEILTTCLSAWAILMVLCSVPTKLLCFITFKRGFQTWKLLKFYKIQHWS